MEASPYKKPVVCFLGPETSYTHQAALQTFPPENFELQPVQTIKDVFDTTQSGRASYGVVPFENSTNGSVVFTLDHFADREARYRDLSVCAEAYLDVHHCLLGYLPTSTTESIAVLKQSEDGPLSGVQQRQPARPLAPLSHVQRIYSHPQAWGQVARFMHTYLKGIETIDVSSTSKAAALAKADSSGTSAAISSALAGELQGLDFLARNIEDREDNTTRFFVLRKGTEQQGSDVPGLAERVPKSCTGAQEGSQQPRTKSLVSFMVPHTAPGALADVLECFRNGGLNLTSINSRPSLSEPFQYIFFVEFEGHKFEDPEGKVREVLQNVGKVAQSWRWLGSWVNMRA